MVKALSPRHEAVCTPHVVFRQVGTSDQSSQVAREIAEIVLGHPQLRTDAPALYSPRPARVDGGTWTPTQAAQPISYIEVARRVVGVRWSQDPDEIALLLDDGELVERNPSDAKRGRSTVGDVEIRPITGQRRPMEVRVRPGRGGHRRRVNETVDPTAELDELSGQIVWRRVSCGAMLAVVELNQTGNAIAATRISSDDRNERLIDQVRPNLALIEREAGLEARWVVLALNMSGTRYVRADREPPLPADEEQRDDLHLIDQAIEAGWCKHVVWRDGDRIARDNLYGEVILRRWQRHRIGLWLATQGRQMDYIADALMLRAMMMVSAEERNNTTRRMQLAKINKGPLRGLGWLGNTPFGFCRRPRTHEIYQDEEQWNYIRRAFELAASGKYLDGSGLSTKQVTAILAAEGCEFDDDRIRKILSDPIYSTGEFIVHVRGIPIAQKPIRLDRPVPVTQFQEVQDLLALRQGRSERTPLGEFLFNYVETVCLRCESPRDEKGNRSLLKGYILPRQSPELRNYRHASWVPEKCKGGKSVFDRDQLERPVVELLRKLAQHPQVLAQLAVASRHDEVSQSGRLSEADRDALRHEIDGLIKVRDGVSMGFVERAGKGESYDHDEHIGALRGFNDKIRGMIERLETEEALVSAERTDPIATQRLNTFLELLSVDTPTDSRHLALRARLFQRCVSRIFIDHDGEGNVTKIEVEGHLVPPGSELATGNPLLNSTDILDAHHQRECGDEPEDDPEQVEIETALSERADKAVSIIYGKLQRLSTTHTVRRRHAHSIDATSWRMRSFLPPRGVAGWRAELLPAD